MTQDFRIDQRRVDALAWGFDFVSGFDVHLKNLSAD
jgi:hypothetical protein